MNTKTLTDTPEIVDLKREFRQLDELTERLKDALIALTGTDARSKLAVLDELEQVRQRKGDIARIVAKISSTTNQTKT